MGYPEAQYVVDEVNRALEYTNDKILDNQNMITDIQKSANALLGGIIEYGTPGTYEVSLPSNTKKVRITACGGGGGGSSGININYTTKTENLNGEDGSPTVIGDIITLPGGTGGKIYPNNIYGKSGGNGGGDAGVDGIKGTAGKKPTPYSSNVYSGTGGGGSLGNGGNGGGGGETSATENGEDGKIGGGGGGSYTYIGSKSGYGGNGGGGGAAVLNEIFLLKTTQLTIIVGKGGSGGKNGGNSANGGNGGDGYVRIEWGV